MLAGAGFRPFFENYLYIMTLKTPTAFKFENMDDGKIWAEILLCKIILRSRGLPDQGSVTNGGPSKSFQFWCEHNSIDPKCMEQIWICYPGLRERDLRWHCPDDPGMKPAREVTWPFQGTQQIDSIHSVPL